MPSILYPEPGAQGTSDAPDLVKMADADRAAYIERVGRKVYVEQLKSQLKGRTVTTR